MQMTERDTCPLSELQSDAEAVLLQVEGTQHSIYLTVQEKPRAVLLSIDEYERLRHLAALASEDEGIRQGEEDIRMGRVYPAEQVLDEIRQQLGLLR